MNNLLLEMPMRFIKKSQPRIVVVRVVMVDARSYRPDDAERIHGIAVELKNAGLTGKQVKALHIYLIVKKRTL